MIKKIYLLFTSMYLIVDAVHLFGDSVENSDNMMWLALDEPFWVMALKWTVLVYATFRILKMHAISMLDYAALFLSVLIIFYTRLYTVTRGSWASNIFAFEALIFMGIMIFFLGRPKNTPVDVIDSHLMG